MSNERKIREEDRFDADLSALKREPVQCPHCGEALPPEPELLAQAEEIRDLDLAEVRYDSEKGRVEIFGGGSGYSEAEPFSIHADRITTVGDVATWMAEIASKPWNYDEGFLERCGQALTSAYRAEAER